MIYWQCSLHHLFILLLGTHLTIQTSSEYQELPVSAKEITHRSSACFPPVEGNCCNNDELFPAVNNADRFRSKDPLSLNATFTWTVNGSDTDISYEVTLVKWPASGMIDGSHATIEQYMPQSPECLPVLDDPPVRASVWHNTSSKSITLEAPYSFTYLLYVRPWNRTSGMYMFGAFVATFEYEACFPATHNADFCREQEIELSSAVNNLAAEVVWNGELDLSVVVSWTEPTQINRDDDWTILKFYVIIKPASINGSLIRVPYESGDPQKIYSLQLTLNPLYFISYSVSVRALHANSGISKEDAVVTFNITAYVEEEVAVKTTASVLQSTVTTAGRDLWSGTAISFLSGSLLIGIILAGVFSTCWCCHRGRAALILRRDNEDNCTECHPIFAEKELLDTTQLKYDVTSPVGTGQYGNVYKGEMLSNGGKEWRTVAIKVAKEHDIGWKEDFLDEIKLLVQLGPHPNIIEIYGCCTVTSPPLLITEFMRYGDLLHFLHKCRLAESAKDDVIYSITESDLIYIALQVARGMNFLSSSKFYHGDLAARNILITEGLKAKISDFGLADDLYMKGYKRMAHGRKRPMRWVSIETLKSGYCSEKSDVWSYGILLFEIFTLGATPYHDVPVHELAMALQDGYRLPKPDSCSQEIYNTMRECWSETPSDRPTFGELEEVFECLQQANESEIDSGTSFISSFNLRNAIFQPHFDEDDMPSLPVSPSTISEPGFMSGAESITDRVSVIDSASVADSVSHVGSVVDSGAGSIDMNTSYLSDEHDACNSDTLPKGGSQDHGLKNPCFLLEEVQEEANSAKSDKSFSEVDKEIRKLRKLSSLLEDEGIEKDKAVPQM